MPETLPFETCPGCGGAFAVQSGPVHRYMISSPGCWAAFGRVLAGEYEDPRLMPVHRLSVDAYAVQHPGDGSRQAVQSVGLHLARLQVQLEKRLDSAAAHAFMLRAAARKAELPALDPPSSFEMTVAQVAPVAGTARHEAMVSEWAEAACRDWSHAHDFIRRWAAEV